MAIDPELKELVSDLRRLTEEARNAGAALNKVGSGSAGLATPGGSLPMQGLRSGGTARDSFRQSTMFGDRSWRENRKDARDVADIVVGSIKGEADQVANGIAGLMPRRFIAGYAAVQAIRFAGNEISDSMKAMTREADSRRDIIKKMNDAGLLTTAMDAKAVQSLYLDKEMGKMSSLQNGIGPGLLRDSMVTPVNFVTGLFGFQAYDTSREITERADKAAEDAIDKASELQEDYFRESRLGNLDQAMRSHSKLGGLVGNPLAHQWSDKVGSPSEIWYRYDQAKTANRIWSACESPRAGPRSEVD